MSATYRSILQQVTEEKLSELRIRKDLLTNHFAPALDLAERNLANGDPKASLQVLYEGLRDTPVKETFDVALIQNLKYLLQNSCQDPSIAGHLLKNWISSVKQEIEHALRKTQYSYLYASLLSEWLASEEEKKRIQNSEESESNLEKRQEEKELATKKIEHLMFSPPSIEEFESNKLREFLSKGLFNFSQDPQSEKILDQIRNETKKFLNIEDCYISTSDVKSCIIGLCAENLLTEEKKSTLNELNENSEALNEVALLLSSKLKNLDRWAWPSCQNLDIRRGLAGEWKGILDEDLITALFLQYIGVEWAAYFKGQFLRIYGSRIWKKVDHYDHCSIEEKRTQFHRATFLSGLPDSVSSQGNCPIEEYVKVESTADADVDVADSPPETRRSTRRSAGRSRSRPPARLRSSSWSTSSSSPSLRPKPDIDFKQSLLHILSTEIRLNQSLRPNSPLFVVQANLESFNSTIVHQAVLILLEYFDIPKSWLEFFRKFLEAEFRIGLSDARKICRGVLESHALSTFFGELLNFMVDFLVNQKSSGLRIFRITDEFWFWSPNKKDVVRGWDTMTEFGQMIGLKIDPKRSGSVAIYGEDKVQTVAGPLPLPQGKIHWGYLELHSNGIFKIDRNAIKKFVDEMKVLLEKSECALEWINIFNKYVGFFQRNFGKCALVFGKSHLDQIIEALQAIYTELFGSENPVTCLKRKYSKLREMETVDAWFYWPLERGGLGLMDPFIGVMALRETYIEIGDDGTFKKLIKEDKIIYEDLREEHEQRYGIQTSCFGAMAKSRRVPTLRAYQTWHEFLATRETSSNSRHWYWRYLRLMERPDPLTPSVSSSYWESGLDSIRYPEGDDGKNYMMWLLNYYERELRLHFGTVDFINSKLLPMSMISDIQKSKVQH